MVTPWCRRFSLAHGSIKPVRFARIENYRACRKTGKGRKRATPGAPQNQPMRIYALELTRDGRLVGVARVVRRSLLQLDPAGPWHPRHLHTSYLAFCQKDHKRSGRESLGWRAWQHWSAGVTLWPYAGVMYAAYIARPRAGTGRTLKGSNRRSRAGESGTKIMSRAVTRHCTVCSARLAWDNTSSLCSPCGKAHRSALHPPAVPDDFWRTPELLAALANWHIGQVIRAYRLHSFHGPKPLAQEVVAGWLGLTQAQVSRIESGEAVTDLAKLIPWAKVLGIPERLLWFKLSAVSTPQTRVSATPVVSPSSAVEDLPRTEANADGPVVEVLRRQLEASKADDGQLGPSQALPRVLRVLGALAQSAREANPRERRALLQIGADGAEFAGWLYRDLRDLRTAVYWYDRAMEWAQEADDPAMQGYVLLRKSQLAYDQRDATRVLSLAEAAGRTKSLPTGVAAEINQQEALGFAMLGEPLRIVESKLDAARALLDKRTNDPTELGASFTSGTLLLRSTACYTEAGKPARAARILGDVIDGGTLSVRDAGYFRARRAAALALSGEPDEAATIGLESLQVAEVTHSGRTVAVLTDTMQVLSRWQSRPHVRALQEALPR